MQNYLVTSESVTEGHPDKLCDQISDGILDAFLAQDPLSRVAVETMVSPNTLFIAGEITSNARVDVEAVARDIARDVGYQSPQSGLDGGNCLVLTNLHTQSADIARGVGPAGGAVGAGDQGVMYGYACDECETLMPLTHHLATRLCRRLSDVRKSGLIPWLYPDGKAQVTVEYSAGGIPRRVTNIVVSAHHRETVPLEQVREAILRDVIRPVVDERWLQGGTEIRVNPAGRFTVGGPMADTGLTGRKLMVDTYGGVGKHGGGAFSGKDPTKVDRSAAYMARYVAKHIVAAKLAGRCEVALAYAIGLPNPEAVSIRTFGTGQISPGTLCETVGKLFSFSVKDILERLRLCRPQYRKTAAYGHFGREDQDFCWEYLDNVAPLWEAATRRQRPKTAGKQRRNGTNP
ncbi:MAG: methionine adenosyltransferase [Oscillospiraceae bacterium]|jgi:S-adenosylmethionine synthetase|nr:methionine adenosyltransferase [Oscillospiraceae bacterium]